MNSYQRKVSKLSKELQAKTGMPYKDCKRRIIHIEKNEGFKKAEKYIKEIISTKPIVDKFTNNFMKSLDQVGKTIKNIMKNPETRGKLRNICIELGKTNLFDMRNMGKVVVDEGWKRPNELDEYDSVGLDLSKAQKEWCKKNCISANIISNLINKSHEELREVCMELVEQFKNPNSGNEEKIKNWQKTRFYE
jgi:cell fate (sporulation/competence/biofilm development) regulator YmcA (YheA/YmcA/DUF963 family)